jgi:hypothetical protein
MFLLGIMAAGLAVGVAAGLVLERLRRKPPSRVGAVVAGLYGLTMVIGIYPRLASELARWSTALWA